MTDPIQDVPELPLNDVLLTDYSTAELREILQHPGISEDTRDHAQWVLRERGANWELAGVPTERR